MGSAPDLADPAYLKESVRQAVKILIVGHFAVGKTTFIGTLSEIPPLRTEEQMTQAGEHVDHLHGVPGKTTTTVAMDFGRITFSNEELVLYLFGTPGQQRFIQVWEDMVCGALGALVLVDPERIADSYPVIDLLEHYGLEYAIGVNYFPSAPRRPEGELREALDVLAETPVVECDPRDEKSSGNALITLVSYLFEHAQQ
ncbi:MAG: GTP-binding protein [Thermocrispum sp.]